jgi:ADP-ribosyl-[dinitrogen reductase] hydrolase
MTKTATRSHWKNAPIVRPHRIEINLRFSKEQFARIKKGLIPEQMEDKWFVFYEEGWLFFHRSWTGFGIYKAQILPEDQDYVMKDFWVERNAKIYRADDDAADREDFMFLIGRGLMGTDRRSGYAGRNIHSEADALSSWSNFGNLMFSNQGLDQTDAVRSALLGVAIGDALGVPVEFKSREAIRENPVTRMTGFGTHNQPPGTWSDDSSLTFCLAEALITGYNPDTIARNFVRWYRDNFWTARGDVFDIGMTTREAIIRLEKGIQSEKAGSSEEDSNGNGSLMRILPLVFYLKDKPIHERFEITRQVSSLTHGHIRSVIACFCYLEFALQLIDNQDKFEIYKNVQESVSEHLKRLKIDPHQISCFDRLLKSDIHLLGEKKIESGGYVLHTLEASIWCLLTTDNFADAVLKAVNLGFDTDTTGAVTGGLAGLLYGYDSIPKVWLNTLARKDDIEDLARRLAGKLDGL